MENTPASSSFDGTIWRYILHIPSKGTQQDGALVAHSCNHLVNEHFIGFLTFSVSLSYPFTILLGITLK